MMRPQPESCNSSLKAAGNGLLNLQAAATTSHKDKGKAIPVRGRGGTQGYETSRLPHFLDNRLTDGGEVVNLTRRPLASRKFPGTHFC
jgi:hypothetical protein